MSAGAGVLKAPLVPRAIRRGVGSGGLGLEGVQANGGSKEKKGLGRGGEEAGRGRQEGRSRRRRARGRFVCRGGDGGRGLWRRSLTIPLVWSVSQEGEMDGGSFAALMVDVVLHNPSADVTCPSSPEPMEWQQRTAGDMVAGAAVGVVYVKELLEIAVARRAPKSSSVYLLEIPSSCTSVLPKGRDDRVDFLRVHGACGGLLVLHAVETGPMGEVIRSCGPGEDGTPPLTPAEVGACIETPREAESRLGRGREGDNRH